MDLTVRFQQQCQLSGYRISPPKQLDQVTQTFLDRTSKSLKRYLENKKDQYDQENEEELNKAEETISSVVNSIKKSIEEMSKMQEQQAGYMVSRNPEDHAHKTIVINCLQDRTGKAVLSLLKWRDMRIAVKQEKRNFEQRFLRGIDPNLKSIKITPLGQHQPLSLDDHGSKDGSFEPAPPSEFERALQSRKQEMLRQIQYDTKRLEEVETKFKNVTEIMNLFSQKVIEQGTATDQILRMAEESLANVKQANKELTKANEYNASYGLYWSVFFMTLAVVLLLLHGLKA